MKISLSLFFAVMLWGCSQKPDFPLEPSITFHKITVTKVKDLLTSTPSREVFKDSVSISINYRDGDGDLGVTDAEKGKANEKEEFNYIVKRFVRVNGVYKAFDPTPSHSGNFITLKPVGKPGPIEGVIHYGIDFFPFNGTKKDTIKFEIQIKDRDNNFSNVVKTDSVLVNELNKRGLK